MGCAGARGRTGREAFAFLASCTGELNIYEHSPPTHSTTRNTHPSDPFTLTHSLTHSLTRPGRVHAGSVVHAAVSSLDIPVTSLAIVDDAMGTPRGGGERELVLDGKDIREWVPGG